MNKETMKAVVSAVVVIVVAAAGAIGFDLDAGAVQNVISAVAFLAATIYGVWKNHNFTQAAQTAQDMIKTAKATETEG